MNEKSALYDQDTLIVFTYAPVGFGHLRVADSIFEGFEDKKPLVLLGASDGSVSWTYRFSSSNPVARSIMEWFQRGWIQGLFTRVYRRIITKRSDHLYKKLNEVIDERVVPVKKLVCICTHFVLAHQLSAIKKKLEKERDIKIIVVVQVTDDSPQFIWYVPGVDVIFVPSIETKKVLEEYGRKEKLQPVNFDVSPYPVNPHFTEALSPTREQQRKDQLNKGSNTLVDIAIPLSGAAVSMYFYHNLIASLSCKSRDYRFHIIAKNTSYTKSFLNAIGKYQNVKTYTSSFDREVVDLYQEVYEKEVISLEVTKPSEQAFKALFYTDQVGGSILLFSKPVGRQEYDNLEFLRRHGMIFTQEETKYLWEKSAKSESISEQKIIELFENRGRLRAVELPWGSANAANFIWWCQKHGIFEKMYQQGLQRSTDIETDPNSVKIFWQKVEEMI